MLSVSIADATFVNQLDDLLNALERPEYYGGRYLSDVLGSATVPAIVSATARTLDPTIRDPQGFLERYMTRIPGLRERVPAKLDVFGREARQGGVALLTPPISAIQANPVVEELVRLNVTLPMPGKKTSKGERTGEEVRRLSEKRGQMYWENLNRLVNSELYKRLTDEEKKRVLERWVRAIVRATQ